MCCSGEGADAEAAFSRTSPRDIDRRLLSDAEVEGLRNGTQLIIRVLFLAVNEQDGQFIGTCSATLAAPWTGIGVGSWGLLAVGTPRGGAGRILVERCEQYLRLAMLEKVSIEYFCIAEQPSSERLCGWYEGRLGYKCFAAKETGQSYRGNLVKGQVFFRHASKALDVTAALQKEAGSLAEGVSQSDLIAARKVKMAQFLLDESKDD